MNNKIFIGIQCRIHSSRFPEKAFTPILGIPLTIRIVQRMMTLKHLHYIALLCPLRDEKIFQDLLEEYHLDIPVFGGSEENVLSRYYEASMAFGADDLIMRVTGDNPLISIPLADSIIDYHREHHCDLSHYLGNPLGTGVEIISFSALKKSHEKAQTAYEKEHVSPYIYKNPHLFKIGEPQSPYTVPYSHLSIDRKEDKVLIEELLSLDSLWDISFYPI